MSGRNESTQTRNDSGGEKTSRPTSDTAPTQRDSGLETAAKKAEGMPASKDNPTKVIAENPNAKANWDRALEKVFGKGSTEKNLEAYRKELESKPSGSSRDAATKQHHAAEKYNEVRREFNRQEGARPSYDYTPSERANLSKGNAPDYTPRPGTGGAEAGTAKPSEPGRQLHHIEHRSQAPERALDPENLAHVEGFHKGSSHHQAHQGEGANRLEQWKQDVAAGKRPEAAPHPEGKGAPHPEGKLPAGVMDAAGKLLGAAGEVLMIRDVAREVDFLRNPDDPKWGKERTDLFGTTWYRNAAGTWTSERRLPDS